MRFHVVGLPHTQAMAEFSACAFTNKVRGFVRMMVGLGHQVFLYAGEITDAPVTELITCISESNRQLMVGKGHYTEAPWNPVAWRSFNNTAIREIQRRIEPGDFICLIGGRVQKPIADAFPSFPSVEFGVGYGGFFSPYKVFESYAWMHTCYGTGDGNASARNGQWYDAVIPGYLDPAEFPMGTPDISYFLFMGRLTQRKGFRVAVEACKVLGAPLFTAGPGVPPDPKMHLGVLGPTEKAKWLGGATALYAPTEYIEPFGNVVIEANACGTPVITTDWGAFTETVLQGKTGFRCRTLGEFVEAGRKAPTLSRLDCRQHVLDNYTLEKIGPRYEAYFKRLSTVYGGKGWYDLSPGTI